MLFSQILFLVLVIPLSLTSSLNDPRVTHLIALFNRAMESPTFQNCSVFAYNAQRSYAYSFESTVELVSRRDWMFRYFFFNSVEILYLVSVGKLCFTDTAYKLTRSIRRKLRQTFLTESMKKRHFGAIKLMIKMLQEIPIPHSPKYLRNISALEYVHKNAAFDYTLKTVDYCALNRTFQDIQRHLRQPVNIENPSQELFNLCTLLAVYLSIIWEKECMDIFNSESIYQIRPMLIFLILNGEDSGYFTRNCPLFFNNHPSKCVRYILSHLTGDVSPAMKALLNASNNLSPLHRLRFHLENHSVILSFEEIPVLDQYLMKKWDLWVLKGLLEIKRYSGIHQGPKLNKAYTPHSTCSSMSASD